MQESGGLMLDFVVKHQSSGDVTFEKEIEWITR
jgi:hypothetical protein